MAGVRGGDSWPYANPMPVCMQIQYPSLCGLGIISQAGKKSLLPVTQEARTTSLPTPSHPIVRVRMLSHPRSLKSVGG